jgi:putative oxidoreductase
MNRLITPAPEWAVSSGLLVARVVLGVAFVLHGWPKMQNPMGWMNAIGMDGVPGALQAVAAGIEFFGGILLAAGLLGRVAALALAAQMVAALALVHIPHGDPFVATNGPSAELAGVHLAFTLLLAATGPGAYSLDAVLFGRERTAATGRSVVPAHG